KSSIDDIRPESPEGATEQGPPNGGYGWVCVACVAFINAHTWGINSSYGVFLAHYLSTNTFKGATPLEFAFVGGLSVSQGLLVAPIATLITRWYGTRVTLLLGLCFETLALIGASFAHQIWHLFLSQGICFGWGLGFLFVGSVGVVPQWFSTKRSLANGLSTGGSGLGGMVYSLASNAMIQHLGVGWALRILGICTFTVNVVATVLIRDRNRQIGTQQRAFDLSLLKRPEFIFLNGWGFFSMLGYIALLFSLPSYASSIGLTARQGSTIGALLNLGQGLGRPLVGYFSDAAGRINMAGSMTFLCGLLCFVVWTFAKTYGVLIFFAIITGAVCGTYWTTVAPVTAEVVGLKELPPALSMTWIFIAFPTTFSEVIGLELRQAHGNIFLRAQIFVAAMYVAAALCMWCVRTWKIGELEEHPR
ncbi:MFS general substrate transporter, partial [Xylona heveae TC161]